MPYKDREKQKEYCRKWQARRRAERLPEVQAIFQIWTSLIARVNGTSNREKDRARYHDRGIRRCREWECFANFLYWAAPLYKKGCEIDRIDNDGDYCPENCRFVSARTNSNNKCNNRIIDLGGIRLTMAQWCRLLGVNKSVVLARIVKFKWPPAEALLCRKLAKPYGKRRPDIGVLKRLACLGLVLKIENGGQYSVMFQPNLYGDRVFEVVVP